MSSSPHDGVRPIAVIATRRPEVRDFLVVHLEQRQFAIEIAHRVEYLQNVLPVAQLVLCDADKLAAVGEVESRPHDVFALVDEAAGETTDGAMNAGALDAFVVPFTEPERLVSVLDSATARAVQRATEQRAGYAIATVA